MAGQFRRKFARSEGRKPAEKKEPLHERRGSVRPAFGRGEGESRPMAQSYHAAKDPNIGQRNKQGVHWDRTPYT
jgi:hypothetical protein